MSLTSCTSYCGGMGIPLKASILYTFHFADDEVVIPQDKFDLKYMTSKVIEEYNKRGLTVNIEKSKYYGIEPQNLLLSDGTQISACTEYKYLGVTFNALSTDDNK